MNATGHETATAGSGNSGEVSREERRMGENGDEQDETAEQARSGGDVASSSSLLVKQPTSLLSLPNKTLVYIFELIYNSATWWSLPANRPSTLPLPLSNLVVSRRFYSLAAPIWLRTLILHNPDSATCTLRAFETAPQRLSIEHVVFYTTPEHLPEQLNDASLLPSTLLTDLCVLPLQRLVVGGSANWLKATPAASTSTFSSLRTLDLRAPHLVDPLLKAFFAAGLPQLKSLAIDAGVPNDLLLPWETLESLDVAVEWPEDLQLPGLRDAVVQKLPIALTALKVTIGELKPDLDAQVPVLFLAALRATLELFRGTKLRDLTIKGETEHLAYDDPIPLLLPSVEVLNLCMPLGVYWNPTLTATYRFLRIFPSLKNLQLPQIDNGDIGVTMSDYLACSPTERHFHASKHAALLPYLDKTPATFVATQIGEDHSMIYLRKTPDVPFKGQCYPRSSEFLYCCAIVDFDAKLGRSRG